MPIVPFARQASDNDADDVPPVEQKFLAMAAAMMHAQGRLFTPQPEEGGQAKMKDFIEQKRDKEDDPDVTKESTETNTPGDPAVDRERGLDSDRDIRRM